MWKCLERLEIPDNLLLCKWSNNSFHHEHDHDFWEFLLVSKGTYRQRINRVERLYSPGEAVLLRPQDIHEICKGQDDDMHLKVIISCRFFKSICDTLNENLYEALLEKENKPLLISGTDMKKFTKIVAQIALSEKMLQKNTTTLKRLLASFILELVYIQNHLPNQSYPKIVQTLIHEISLPQNISINVSTLMEKLNYSYSYAARLFKQFTGFTINQFILSHKMDTAKELLLQTNASILDISLDLGFSSLSYFMKLFKSTYGISPGFFRKQHRSD